MANKEKILMSVCIAAYNRCEQLTELIKPLLRINRDDFNIVITDNCSTDDTVKTIEGFNDQRVVLYQNTKPLPGLNNMTEAIFNGSGKYAFYCNDRDFIYTPGFIKLLDVLKSREFSFVWTKPDGDMAVDGKLYVYKRGYQSLVSQEHAHHPTGMVFNANLIRKFLNKQTYFGYLKDQYEYSFLMRDLLQYADSAIFNEVCWRQRPEIWLADNKGKTVEKGILYFYPEVQCLVVKDVLRQVMKENNYSFTKEQRIRTGMFFLLYYYKLLISFKYGMHNKNMTAHYGVESRTVSTKEMIKAFDKYYYSSLNYLEEQEYPRDLIEWWEGRYDVLRRNMCGMSWKADYVFIMEGLKKKRNGKKYGE